ncbi:response regulator [Deinococcus navajonensis]|uniref:Response regulator n=1 Tax=Deinococcus navajonensis TaxID=309884 RepID=A0ABV8XK23_9DEIO
MKRILLIEDQMTDALLLQEWLFDAGVTWEVHEVATFAAAQAAWAAGPFDAMLLDLDLPDGYGLELLERALTLAGHVPVVVLSGNADPGLSASVRALGGAGQVLKGEAQLGALLSLLDLLWSGAPRR